MLRQGRDRRLLLRPKCAQESAFQLRAAFAKVLDVRCYTMTTKQIEQIFQASSWQREVLLVKHCTGDDPWLIVRGPPHRLGLIELGVLKRRQPYEPRHHR